MKVPELQAAVRDGGWPACPYRIELTGGSDAARALPPETLCAFTHGGSPDGDARRLVVPLRPLAHSNGALAPRTELWLSQRPVRHGWDDGIGYSENGEMLVLQLRLEEDQLQPLADGVYGAYRRIAGIVAARGYPELWRVWHYLGEINEGEGDGERYRQFCVGRYRALDDHNGFEARLPAASAIGARGGGLSIIALAGKLPGLQVENPRQVSAFRYPRAYGPRSPSFSRATLLPFADGPRLLVSGTASIVGHATAHAGDTLAQLRQTASNLDALLSHAVHTLLPGRRAAEFAAESYIVYLRHDEDLPLVQPELRRLFGDTPLQVLAGDVCRPELLIEIEAVYRMAAAGA
jgi:chorismate lyase / 3-hydroxybenzoate synthase